MQLQEMHNTETEITTQNNCTFIEWKQLRIACMKILTMIQTKGIRGASLWIYKKHYKFFTSTQKLKFIGSSCGLTI
jgi:hypothetical protein